MPRKSKAATLPAELKAWLDSELVRRGFSDYVQLAQDLSDRGAGVSKSALQRYGSQFEERLARLKQTADQARAVVSAAPDDEGAINEALIRLTQDKLMELLVDVDVQAETKEAISLPKLTKAIADLARASVGQKRWQAEALQRAKAAADAAESIARRGGLSEQSIKDIRSEILGVAS